MYKARIIWSNFEPDALYDDRLLCMPQTQAKGELGATNNVIDIDSLLMSQAQAMIAANNNVVKNTPDDFSISTKVIEDISIYPNPATTAITVKYANEHGGKIRIMNALGEVILNEKLLGTETTKKIGLEKLANGIYHYDIIFEDGKKSVGKLTVNK